MKHVYINAFDGIPYEALITITDEATFIEGRWSTFVTFPTNENICHCLVDCSFHAIDSNQRFVEFMVDNSGSIAKIPVKHIQPTSELLGIADTIVTQQCSRIARKLTLHCTPDR